MPSLAIFSAGGTELNLAPMTVTAGKRSEDIQSIPIAISAFGAETIAASRAEGIEKFAETTPNLKFYSVGSRRTALLYMRGLGSSGPNMPAVGLFVDDVYYPKTGLSDTSLTGVERVEVMRGPQSTLYGRNTEAGAINLITARPGPAPQGRIAVTVGDYDLYKTDLELSGPANSAGQLFYSLSGSFLKRSGYTRNDLLDEDVDHRNRYAGRMKINWLAADDFQLSLSVYGDRDRDGGYALTTLDQLRADPHHVEHNISGTHKREMLIYDLQARYTAPNFELLSITAFRDWSNRDQYDQDFSALDISTLYDTDSMYGFSQELRLISNSDSSISWLGGVYFYHNRENDDNFTTYGRDAGVYGATPGMRSTALLDVETWGLAPFGRITYALTERLRATAGLRFEHQEKTADGRRFFTMNGYSAGPDAPFEADQNYDEWMPEAGLAYDLTENAMGYLRVARGFREGGFNNGEQGADAVYDPERAWSYEAGIKSSWLEEQLAVNLAIFQMDIENQQLIQFKPSGFGFSFKNAGESRNRGAELELSSVPADWIELRAGIGYIDTEFRSFSDPALGADYSGNSIPFVPNYNYFANVILKQETVRDIVAHARLGITGTGSTKWDDANQVETGAYTLLNASLGFTYKRYEFSVFGRNLTDKTYPSAVYAFPNSSPIAQPGAPRTFGLMLSATL